MSRMIKKIFILGFLSIITLDETCHTLNLFPPLPGESEGSSFLSKILGVSEPKLKWRPKPRKQKSGKKEDQNQEPGLQRLGFLCPSGEKGYDDPDLGRVELTEKDCSPATPTNLCLRQGRDCCQPQPPDQVLKGLIFYHSDGIKVDWRDPEVPEKYDFDECDTFIYAIHGFLEDYKGSACQRDTVETYQKLGNCVSYVDWSLGNHNLYQKSAANVQTTGRIIAFSATIGTF